MDRMTPHTPVEGLVAIAARLRNLSRIMAGGDGTKRLDTPAWEHAAKLADELEAALASLPVEGWRSISEAPETELLGEGLAALVYSPEFGVQIGRVYNFAGDKPRGFASGFNGDWNVTHFQRLPAAPQDQRQGNEQGGHP